MRFFLIQDTCQELNAWPEQLDGTGFMWVACSRSSFEQRLDEVQHRLQLLGGGGLVDLHVSDLLNPQLPSQYDYTSWYDLLVFRRLASAKHDAPSASAEQPSASKANGTSGVAAVDTNPVGFALFDRVLLTVHPDECSVRDYFQNKLLLLAGQPSPPRPLTPPTVSWANAHDLLDDADPHMGLDPVLLEEQRTFTRVRAEARGVSRLPPSSADLMLRMVNHMVDGYLDLRRQLTRHLSQLQKQMLRSGGRFRHWPALLASRNTLHLLEDICEDQRSAMQEWIDAIEDWPVPTDPVSGREREVLRVRSRDIQEHIERVLNHVRRLESSAESAVQMHFSLQGSRTNDIMRTLTALTAIFLPLNLVTGVFGMNFDALPLIHSSSGFWLAFGFMALIVVILVWWFRRNRYLGD